MPDLYGPDVVSEDPDHVVSMWAYILVRWHLNNKHHTPDLIASMGSAECLARNAREGGQCKGKCPFCRVEIESKAPNLTLQQLVQSYADKQEQFGTEQVWRYNVYHGWLPSRPSSL